MKKPVQEQSPEAYQMEIFLNYVQNLLAHQRRTWMTLRDIVNISKAMTHEHKDAALILDHWVKINLESSTILTKKIISKYGVDHLNMSTKVIHENVDRVLRHKIEDHGRLLQDLLHIISRLQEEKLN